MNGATSELSLTAVAVIAIAAIAALFTTLVWPTIKTNITHSTRCANAECPASCTSGSTCDCTYYEGDTAKTINCKMK